jgi:hypothetical protein
MQYSSLYNSLYPAVISTVLNSNILFSVYTVARTEHGGIAPLGLHMHLISSAKFRKPTG